jgi:hypothetical protein
MGQSVANLVSSCNHIFDVRRRFDEENCSVAQGLEVLGDWWTLLVVREAFFGTRRFADFEANLGISKNVLAKRLTHLVRHGVLERVPPELSSDIAENGICMTGGGSLLYGLDRLLSEKTGIPCYVAEDAISCVAIGTGMALDNMDLYSNGTVYDYRRGDFYENY